uniref:Uncharacterized protein n=1 Tax=Meloidogyne floridensis TaxID=298350 RepID=A0A915NID6_9BILA
MKIIIIFIILFINALFWSFVSTSSSSRHKGEGSTSRRQYMQEYKNKMNNRLEQLKEKNGCTGYENREINPNGKTQIKLIKLYLKNNEKFRDAVNMTKNPKIKRWFDRIEDEEYKSKYGKYGEVSMDNLKKYVKIQQRAVQFVLAAHGICVYNNHKNRQNTLFR